MALKFKLLIMIDCVLMFIRRNCKRGGWNGPKKYLKIKRSVAETEGLYLKIL